MRRLLFALALLLRAAFAQDAPPPGVHITFLPPPLDGTLSAGIYTKEGKLVRVLAREATEKDFTVGLNGFIARWDGKDDAGKELPAATYFVRGFGVGELEVEGEAFHGNDWIKDEDSLRFGEVDRIVLIGTELMVSGTKPDGKQKVHAAVKLDNGAVRFFPDGEVPVVEESKGSSAWTIERVDDANPSVVAIVQRSPDGKEVLRRLDYEAGEPQPQTVIANADNQKVCLLERNASETRVRILTLQEPAKDAQEAVSKWGIVFSASVKRAPVPDQLAAFLKRTPPPKVEASVRQALIPNELIEGPQAAQAAVQLEIGFDEHGSFLRTTDGLPLRRVTDTRNLKWAVLSREADGALTLFQSDGAAVEEFRLKKLDQMMAFEAGDYEWAPPK
jgi:hypothetical protein